MARIAARLATITPANGYVNTIAAVQRHNLSGISIADLPTLLIKEGNTDPEKGRSVYPNVQKRMGCYIVVITTQVGETPTGGAILNSLLADVEKCVQGDRSWGGLAIDTDPAAYMETELDMTMPHLSKALFFECIFEHVRDDPYAQG